MPSDLTSGKLSDQKIVVSASIRTARKCCVETGSLFDLCVLISSVPIVRAIKREANVGGKSANKKAPHSRGPGIERRCARSVHETRAEKSLFAAERDRVSDFDPSIAGSRRAEE
jgi:hypothetical protein